MREPYDSPAQYGRREQDESVLGLFRSCELARFHLPSILSFCTGRVQRQSSRAPSIWILQGLRLLSSRVVFQHLFCSDVADLLRSRSYQERRAHVYRAAISTARTRRSDHSQRRRFAVSSSAERIGPLCLLFSPRVEHFGDRTTTTRPACPTRCPSESRYANAPPDAATRTAAGRACCYSETARVTICATESSPRIQTRQPASIRSF